MTSTTAVPAAWLRLAGTLALAATLLGAPAVAGQAGTDTGTVTAFNLTLDQGTTEATFSIPDNLQYHLFTLANPNRLVLDFLNARVADGVALDTGADPLIADIRTAPRFNGQGERLVFDLRQGVIPHSYLRHDEDRAELVVTFGSAVSQAPPPSQPAPPASTRPMAISAVAHAPKRVADAAEIPATEPVPAPAAVPVMTASEARPQRLRDLVVAIDPGHGGHDSGAIGPDGLEEKNVTLAIARDLYAILSKVPGIKPVLTRTGDYYVSLDGRREIAHKDHADLFISIHADSSPYHYPKGSTVYVLSEHGASSVAARILADTENSSDEVAGVNLSDEEPMVRSTILNLSQSGTLIRSMQLAGTVMDGINDDLPLHSDKVERAAFVVLKSPDIPSILVETAFISNRTQEHELATAGFRNHVAAMIAHGIESYANRYAPPGTLIAARRDAINTLKQG